MKTVKPTRNTVLIHNFRQGNRTIGKIIIPDDDGTDAGIRPRWAQVYAIGSNVDTLEVGQWVLMEHGRWSREMTIRDDADDPLILWTADWPNGVLAYSDEEPVDETFGVVPSAS